MPVETIECQIVQAQLGRYLSGEAFSNEALSQLENHIADCTICRQEVAVRRATLQALLGPATPNAGRPEALIGALRESQAASTKTIPTHALVEQSVKEQMAPESVSPSPTSKRLSKPLIYGSALALVLVAMSYIGNNPTSVFGDRAATSSRTETPVSTITNPVVEPAPAPTPDPVNVDEWVSLGFAEWLPFDSTDAGSLEPWEWFSLSEALPEVLSAASTETEPPSDEIPSTVATQPAPTEAAATVRPATARPRPTAPRRTRPRPQTPPTNSIRVYEPGQ